MLRFNSNPGADATRKYSPERRWHLYARGIGEWSVWTELAFERHLRNLYRRRKKRNKSENEYEPMWY